MSGMALKLLFVFQKDGCERPSLQESSESSSSRGAVCVQRSLFSLLFFCRAQQISFQQTSEDQ